MSIMNVASTGCQQLSIRSTNQYSIKLNMKFSSILKILTYRALLKKLCIYQIAAADCHQEPAAAAGCEERQLCCDDRDTACHHSSQHSYVSVSISLLLLKSVHRMCIPFFELYFLATLSGCSGMVFFTFPSLLTYMNNFSN